MPIDDFDEGNDLRLTVKTLQSCTLKFFSLTLGNYPSL